jgi:hypothetical protein
MYHWRTLHKGVMLRPDGILMQKQTCQSEMNEYRLVGWPGINGTAGSTGMVMVDAMEAQGTTIGLMPNCLLYVECVFKQNILV